MCTSAKNSYAPRRSRWCLAFPAVLGACTVGPDFRPPVPPVAQAYNYGGDPQVAIATGGVSQTVDPAANLPAAWWALFRAPALDAMVREAAKNNPSIEAAQAALRAAEFELRAGHGIFYPAIEGRFSAARERAPAVATGEAGQGRMFSLLTLGTTVSYALDVFGGDRRLVEALGAAADLQREEMRATALAVAANVVNTAIARAAYEAERAVTVEIAANLKDQAHLSRVRAEAGTGSYAAALALESQLASIEATLPVLQQKIDQATDLLATLVGTSPAAWMPPALDLSMIELPPTLPLSMPSALVRQRPDIRAAEASLHAANAAIGVATAAMFPSVTLDAAYSANGGGANALFAGGGAGWKLGTDVAFPLFEGGMLWFKRKAAIASYERTAAIYRQTVLSAFQQVADTLKALEHDAAASAAEARAMTTAAAAQHLTAVDYDAGLVSYDELLIANATRLQAHLAYVQVTATRLQDCVALFVALGGGWWAG